MKLAREETRIMVTSSFYRKNNLKFKGRNRNRNRGKKIGTRNRNQGKMARFRNTDEKSKSILTTMGKGVRGYQVRTQVTTDHREFPASPPPSRYCRPKIYIQEKTRDSFLPRTVAATFLSRRATKADISLIQMTVTLPKGENRCTKTYYI
jgi:hypothetical protein